MQNTTKWQRITTAEPAAAFLAEKIKTSLEENKAVLWLVPGGSGIAVAAEVSKLLAHMDLSNLTVTLTDERYGPIGHPDSDWLHLEEAGFQLPGATLVPVLTGENRTATTDHFSKTLQELLEKSDYKLGFFGIGPDGHTAGILPHSVAAESTELACEYDAGQFERITTTPATIAMLDEIVVYGMGEAKKPTLEQLNEDYSVVDQPAQALKQVPLLTIFTDQLGDPL